MSSKSSPNIGLSPTRARRPSYHCLRLIKAEHSLLQILTSFRWIVSVIHPCDSASLTEKDIKYYGNEITSPTAEVP